MKIGLMILVLFVFGFMAQAQELPKNWQKRAGRAYTAKDGWVISIVKIKAKEYSDSRKMAMDTAKFLASNLLKIRLGLDTLQYPVYEVLDEENLFDTKGNLFVCYVAIKAKNYLVDMKKKTPED